MVIHAVKVLSASKRERLAEILDMKEKSEGDVRDAIFLLEESGSVEYARSIARELVLKSWKKLDKKLPESGAKVLLKEFADYLIERNI